MKVNIIESIKKIVHNIEPKADIIYGINDYHIATNATLINRNISTKLIEALKTFKYIQHTEIVNGFLNIKLHMSVIDNISYDYNVGKNSLINIEYCSPNPTGPLHLGHLRTTLYGASMVNLYRICGYNIVTDIYINDDGNQFSLFIDSVRHYHDSVAYPNLEYKGEYVKEYALSLSHDFKREDLCALLVAKTQKVLKILGIRHDRVIYETLQKPNADIAVQKLKEKNLITVGQLKNQKKEGDMTIVTGLEGCSDFVVSREDGSYTYVGNDIGYSYGKYCDGFNHQICTVGEDHIGHVKKMNTVMQQINSDINLSVIYTGIVKFEVDGELLKMSKRQGTFVTIEDVLSSGISINALSQGVFQHAEKQPITINMANINENRVYNIIYVYNCLKQGKDTYIDDKLMRYIAFWDVRVKASLTNNSPHLIYVYIVELADYIFNNKLFANNLPSQLKEIFELSINILLLKNEM